MITDFRYANASYLSLLLMIPLIILLIYFFHLRTREKIKKFASEKMLARLLPDGIPRTFDRAAIFILSAIILFIFALARPQGNPQTELRESQSLDIMAIIDVSKSMDTEDIYPSRLKKATHSVSTLLEKLDGDRVGIVAFAGTAVLICPLTSDYEIVRTFLASIDTNMIQNQGTNIEEALRASMEAFKRGAQNNFNSEDHKHAIILFSDGEVTSGSTFDEIKNMANAGISIFTIAVGTEKGAPIPIRDSNGMLQTYKKDPQGTTVLSKVYPETLQKLSEVGSGTFYFSTLDESEIINIIDKMKNFSRKSNKEVKAQVYTEYFQYPLLLGLVLFIFTLVPFKNKKSLVVLLAILYSNNAFAFEWPSLLWSKEKKQNEKALDYIKKEEYNQALDVFKELQAENPYSEELSYNLGTTLLLNKNLESGRKSLEPQVNGNTEINNYSKFNLAGSYAAEDKTLEAKQKYAALISQLNSKNKLTKSEQALLMEAKKNLEFLTPKQQEQQKQNQQQQDEKKKKDEAQKKQKNEKDKSSKDKKEGEQKDQGDDENKDPKDEKPEEKPQQRKKQKFKEREDLSENDAKRILEELKQQEVNIQKKFIKNKEKNSKFKNNENQKDW